jgi:hypothetical protein
VSGASGEFRHGGKVRVGAQRRQSLHRGCDITLTRHAYPAIRRT